MWALSETGPALVAEVSGTGANIALGLGNGGIVVAGAARPAFQHTTSAGSVTAPNGTRIDHPLTNGDPTAMSFLTHAFVSGAAVYWTHPTGVDLQRCHGSLGDLRRGQHGVANGSALQRPGDQGAVETVKAAG